jgi:Fur family transcriptional regulator, peroxide stress response regulator
MWRKTPQTILVINTLSRMKHATVQELSAEARKSFPRITNTTVHRITSRLVATGLATTAPSLNHVKVIDANTRPHDHFLCQVCHKIVDIKISDDSFMRIQEQLPGELLRDNILIAGVCKKCEQHKP